MSTNSEDGIWKTVFTQFNVQAQTQTCKARHNEVSRKSESTPLHKCFHISFIKLI